MRKLIITGTLLALGIAAHGQVTTPQVRDSSTASDAGYTSIKGFLRWTILPSKIIQ